MIFNINQIKRIWSYSSIPSLLTNLTFGDQKFGCVRYQMSSRQIVNVLFGDIGHKLVLIDPLNMCFFHMCFNDFWFVTIGDKYRSKFFFGGKFNNFNHVTGNKMNLVDNLFLHVCVFQGRIVTRNGANIKSTNEVAANVQVALWLDIYKTGLYLGSLVAASIRSPFLSLSLSLSLSHEFCSSSSSSSSSSVVGCQSLPGKVDKPESTKWGATIAISFTLVVQILTDRYSLSLSLSLSFLFLSPSIS